MTERATHETGENILALASRRAVPRGTAIVDISAVDHSIDVDAATVRIAPPWDRFCFGWEAGEGQELVAVLALGSATKSPEDDRWTIAGMIVAGNRRGSVAVGNFSLIVGQFGEYVDYEVDAFRPDLTGEGAGVVAMGSIVRRIIVALDIANCRNIGVMPTKFPRPAQRRIQRIAAELTIGTLVVMPTNYRPGTVPTVETGAVPLTSIRGHFAHYGDCCPGGHEPRGLYFGKGSGRYWIPQHARGTLDAGERINRYEVRS